jgi:flavorubredoxin
VISLQVMGAALKRLTFAFESGHWDECANCMGEIQEAMNNLATAILEEEERAKVADARRELERCK